MKEWLDCRFRGMSFKGWCRHSVRVPGFVKLKGGTGDLWNIGNEDCVPRKCLCQIHILQSRCAHLLTPKIQISPISFPRRQNRIPRNVLNIEISSSNKTLCSVGLPQLCSIVLFTMQYLPMMFSTFLFHWQPTAPHQILQRRTVLQCCCQAPIFGCAGQGHRRLKAWKGTASLKDLLNMSGYPSIMVTGKLTNYRGNFRTKPCVEKDLSNCLSSLLIFVACLILTVSKQPASFRKSFIFT